MIEHVIFPSHSALMQYITSGAVCPYKILYGGTVEYLPKIYSRYSVIIPPGGALLLKSPV